MSDQEVQYHPYETLAEEIRQYALDKAVRTVYLEATIEVSNNGDLFVREGWVCGFTGSATDSGGRQN